MNSSKNLTPSIEDFIVGEYYVVASRNLLLIGDKEIAITPKMLAVLSALANRQGETVSKEQLMEKVWGEVVTSDMALSRVISDLRKVLNDSARQPTYIETVSKQGYRLKVSVEWLTELRHREVGVKPYLKYFLPIITCVLLLAVIYFLRYMPTKKEYLQAPKVRQLTNDKHYQRQVRFSPDGNYLVYSKTSDGTPISQLVVHSLADNQLSELTEGHNMNETMIRSPVFSPNGKQIAYVQIKNKSCEIIVLNLIERKSHFLAECQRGVGGALDWSRDGRLMVTSEYSQQNKVESLVLYNAASGKKTMLASPKFEGSYYLFPRFSKDGTRVAVVSYQERVKPWAIGLINIDTGNYTEVIQSTEQITQVTWGDDEDSLYYAVEANFDSGIWQIDINSKKTKQILNEHIRDLDYNQLNQTFSYVKEKRKFNIWKTDISLHEQKETEPVFPQTDKALSPSLSSDDKTLAFVVSSSQGDGLWVKELTTGKLKQLYQSKGGRLKDPIWSNSGEELLVIELQSGFSKVLEVKLAISVNSRARVRVHPALQDKEINIKQVRWSTDKSKLYWYQQKDQQYQLLEKNLLTNEERLLLSDNIIKFEIDEQQLYYQLRDDLKIYTLSITDGLNVEIQKLPIDLVRRRPWQLVSGGIYFEQWSKNERSAMLYYYDFSKQTKNKLIPVETFFSEYVRRWTVSKEQRFIYHTRKQESQMDLVIMSPP